MADIGLNISTNILIHPFETWDDVPLSPFFRAKVEELNLKLQPTHKYGLGPILEGKSLMITSPSGTMRSSCAINALFLKDMKAYTDEVLRKLSNKHIYWFSSPVPDEVTKEVFLKTKPDGVVVDIEDQRVLHVVKFYFKFYQTEQDQFLFIRKLC